MGRVVCVNRGLGWASSGVEYAQAYRARALRLLGVDALFAYTDFISAENIEHLSRALGFLDEEVIWLYSYFTDFPLGPTTYTREALEASFGQKPLSAVRRGGVLVYTFPRELVVEAHSCREDGEGIFRAAWVQGGQLLRQDFFTSGRLFSEYYAPKEGTAGQVCLRRFYNQDGSEAMTEIVDENRSLFRVGKEILDSKERLIAYFLKSLNLSKEDVLLLDRGTDIAQAALRERGGARLGCVVHADHFSPQSPNPDHLLWNNFYEYEITHADQFDFFLCSTQEQSDLLKRHLSPLGEKAPAVVTIPVGSLAELSLPLAERTPFSLLTCSRLAPEKHIEWLVRAVAAAREKVPQITLDIYGTGPEEGVIREAIEQCQAQGYVRLLGHKSLEGVYERYSAYASASTSEGFGLTLMEAVGSGLPLVGFDVPYGNRAFIEEGENGFLVSVPEGAEPKELTAGLAKALIRLFTEADLSSFEAKSYEKAQNYLAGNVARSWKRLLEGEGALEERGSGREGASYPQAEGGR